MKWKFPFSILQVPLFPILCSLGHWKPGLKVLDGRWAETQNGQSSCEGYSLSSSPHISPALSGFCFGLVLRKKFTYHTVHHFKVRDLVHSVVLSKFTRLFNHRHHHYNLIPEHFHYSRKKPCVHYSHFPFLAPWSPSQPSINFLFLLLTFSGHFICMNVTLLSLNTMFSRLISVVLSTGILFLYIAKYHFIVWIDHILFIHFPVDGQLIISTFELLSVLHIILVLSSVTRAWFFCKPSNVCVLTASVMSNFVTPWTVARQAPLSMEFSRQEYWSGLPFRSPEDLPDLGIEPASPESAGGFFTTELPGKPENFNIST